VYVTTASRARAAGQDEDCEEDDPGGAADKEDNEASLGWTDDEAAHGLSELTAFSAWTAKRKTSTATDGEPD
jgi:hypothetical protein